jgi:hypothetical protein
MAKQAIDRLDAAIKALDYIPDDDLQGLSFSMPWQYDPESSSKYKDPDGFDADEKDTAASRKELQEACWAKFNKNPFVGTSIRGIVGRLTGYGFEICSDIKEIQSVITQTEYDWRNRLYNYWRQFVGRSMIEGELFLCLTLWADGFVEVDFLDPATIEGGDGNTSDGIIYHPNKSLLPLIYIVSRSDGQRDFIPSVFVARSPGLLRDVDKSLIDQERLYQNWKPGTKYRKLGGFYRFVVSWDRGFLTRRNVSYLRTIISWLNHYENLKKYEIDHKKSSGAYLWKVTITDAKAFKLWLALSDEDRRKTGIMAKKTPGSTIVLPPGMDMLVTNPQLPKISEADTDILHLITGGLDEPEDIATGQSKGTYASVKASRGPMSDRTSDEIAYFDRFLKFDFYGSIFYLRSAVTDFPTEFSVRQAVDFDRNQKPIFKNVKYPPEHLIDVNYPTSEVIDIESRAKGYLGVKHGSTNKTLGVANETIAKKMGIGNYKRERLKAATEEDKFPQLQDEVDQESEQEKRNEPGKKKNKKDETGGDE